MKNFKLFIALVSVLVLFGGTSCEDGGSSSGGEDGVYISDISSTRYPSSSTWRILDDSISTAQVKNFVSDLQQIREDSPSKLIALDFVNVEEFYNVDGGVVVGTEYISEAHNFSGCDILASVTLSKAQYCGVDFRECTNLTTISLPCMSDLASLVCYDGKVVTKLVVGTSASGVPVNGYRLGLYNVTSCSTDIFELCADVLSLDVQCDENAGNPAKVADLEAEIAKLLAEIDSMLEQDCKNTVTTLVTKENSDLYVRAMENGMVLHGTMNGRMFGNLSLKSIVYQ